MLSVGGLRDVERLTGYDADLDFCQYPLRIPQRSYGGERAHGYHRRSRRHRMNQTVAQVSPPRAAANSSHPQN